jgi:hypothetical protein
MPGFVSRSKRRSFVGKRSTPGSVVAEGAAAGIAKSGRSSNGQGGALSHTASWNGSLSPNGGLRAGPAAVTCPYCLLEMLGAVPPRDYSYELFWVVFPLKTSQGKSVFTASDKEAELSVRMLNRVGKVRWPIPDYIRTTGSGAR